MSHGDGGPAGAVAFAHREVHRLVRRSGLADDIDEGFAVENLGRLGGHDVGVAVQGAVLVARLSAFHEGTVNVPGDFVFAHPERLDGESHLRAFVVAAARFVFGRADGEFAAGDGDHVEARTVGLGNGFGVGLHRRFIGGTAFFHDESVDLFGDGEILWTRQRAGCGGGGRRFGGRGAEGGRGEDFQAAPGRRVGGFPVATGEQDEGEQRETLHGRKKRGADRGENRCAPRREPVEIRRACKRPEPARGRWGMRLPFSVCRARGLGLRSTSAPK